MVYSCLEQNLMPIVIPKEQKERYMSCLRDGNIEEFVKFAQETQEEERLIGFLPQALKG